MKNHKKNFHKNQKELEILIVEKELDITGIPETWCDDSWLEC